jgi:hypothetical protein
MKGVRTSISGFFNKPAGKSAGEYFLLFAIFFAGLALAAGKMDSAIAPAADDVGQAIETGLDSAR